MTDATQLFQKKERFEKIYFQTRAFIFHYIGKFITTGQQGIEDVLQECYMRLWQNIDAINDDENILPLLRTYAINHSISHLQKYAKEKVRETFYHSQQPLATDMRDELHFRDVLSAFNKAVELLPPQRRLIYRLVKEKGLSYQQISAELGISPKTIERHINEAMRTLRSQFTPERILFALILLKIEG